MSEQSVHQIITDKKCSAVTHNTSPTAISLTSNNSIQWHATLITIT